MGTDYPILPVADPDTTFPAITYSYRLYADYEGPPWEYIQENYFTLFDMNGTYPMGVPCDSDSDQFTDFGGYSNETLQKAGLKRKVTLNGYFNYY